MAGNAGALAGTLNALETIPLLIFAQATEDEPEDTGDLAWIAVQTQQAYIAELEPIVGGGAGAFAPVPGIASDGFVLRAVDAVVIVYRTPIHRALVNLTTHDWGRSTADFGYDMPRWYRWYNEEYVPHVNERRRLEALSREP